MDQHGSHAMSYYITFEVIYTSVKKPHSQIHTSWRVTFSSSPCLSPRYSYIFFIMAQQPKQAKASTLSRVRFCDHIQIYSNIPLFSIGYVEVEALFYGRILDVFFWTNIWKRNSSFQDRFSFKSCIKLQYLPYREDNILS